jgi:translation initiation factor IF-3
VRVVGGTKHDGEMLKAKALDIAKSEGLDLVLINQKSTPPVCKIIDYSKHVFDQKKKDKEQKKNAKKTVVKEIQLSYKIGQHDIDYRLDKGEKWLDAGFTVKLRLLMKGRAKYMPSARDEGELVMLNFIKALCERVEAQVTQGVKYSNNTFTAMVNPKKK